MHKGKFHVSLSIGMLLILVAPVAGQDNDSPADNAKSILDIHPSDIRVEKSSGEQPGDLPVFPRLLRPRQTGNLQPARPNQEEEQAAIFDNELRETPTDPPRQSKQSGQPERFQSTFDSQPLPPEPANQNDGLNRPANPAVDPMDELNPNRLMPRFEPQRPTNQSPAAFLEPEIPARSMDQSIPATPSGSDPPVMTATEIPDNFSEDSGSVLSAGFQQISELQQPGPNSPAEKVKSLLAYYNISSAPQPLPGIPASIKDLLRTTPPGSRLSMVQQYWETWFDWAVLQNRRSHASWLNQLPNPRSGPEQLLLQTARSMAVNEILAAEIQLSRSQSKLQQLSQWSEQELLPLPQNEPLVNKYITHYEWYAQRQRMPWKLKGINEMLPRTYALIAQRADTIGQSEQARNQIQQAALAGQLGIGDVLESGRVWQASMQGFVSTVVSYNQAISDYALTIAPAQNSLEQVVSMLVAKPESVVEVAQKNSILQRNTQTLPTSNRIGTVGTTAVPNPQSATRRGSTFESQSLSAPVGNQPNPQFNSGGQVLSPTNDTNQFNGGSGGAFGGG